MLIFLQHDQMYLGLRNLSSPTVHNIQKLTLDIISWKLKVLLLVV